jgi:hypothetical protein
LLRALPRLDDEQFSRWAALLQRRTGIQWPMSHVLPGGCLVWGPGEGLGWNYPDMEHIAYRNTLAFRRI